MQILRVLLKVAKKVKMYFCRVWIKIRYKTRANVNISGKVYLDSENITWGKNVSLYPNVHLMGPGKLVLGDNVIIGDGTVICTANHIEIGKDQ